jgi:YD repeat-containing protein
MTTHPGDWPITQPVDLDELQESYTADEIEQRQRYNAQRARIEITLNSVRADLEEQPSPACIRAAARRWHDAITAMTDDVTAALLRNSA